MQQTFDVLVKQWEDITAKQEIEKRFFYFDSIHCHDSCKKNVNESHLKQNKIKSFPVRKRDVLSLNLS